MKEIKKGDIRYDMVQIFALGEMGKTYSPHTAILLVKVAS